MYFFFAASRKSISFFLLIQDFFTTPQPLLLPLLPLLPLPLLSSSRMMRISSLIGSLTALSSVFLASTSAQVCDNVTPKLSCGLSYTTEAACTGAGCCWDSSSEASPACFAPAVTGYYYTETQNAGGVRSGTLALSSESGIFGGGDFASLDMTVTQETESRTHIKIVPTESTQWEIPETLLPRPGGNYDGNDALTTVQITSDPAQPMDIVISRVEENSANAENIFIFSKNMVFQEQYLQFVLDIPSGKAAFQLLNVQ